MPHFLSALVRTCGGQGAGSGTGGPRSGQGRARRRGFRAPPWGARITEGRSAAASLSPTRRPRNIRPFTPSHWEWRKAPCSRGVPGPPSAPRVRGALPGFPTLPLRKWCAALGEAEAALWAGVLALRELLFTGEVGRALELPLAGRRVAAEWWTVNARVRTRLGGDLAPKPGPHAGS